MECVLCVSVPTSFTCPVRCRTFLDGDTKAAVCSSRVRTCVARAAAHTSQTSHVQAQAQLGCSRALERDRSRKSVYRDPGHPPKTVGRRKATSGGSDSALEASMPPDIYMRSPQVGSLDAYGVVER